MLLCFLVPLIGLVLYQAKSDSDPEQANGIRIATLAGFFLYLAVFALRVLL